MSDGMNDRDQAIGYGRPPTWTRFKKGQSGNPKGRPRDRRRDVPYDALLGQMVTVREDGRERRITAAEAFILQLTRKGLAGDSAAARASLTAIEEARSKRELGHSPVMRIICKAVSPGSVGCALDSLGLATKLHRFSDSANYELKPWLVELALARLRDRRLSYSEQRTIVQVTSTPEKVRWPDWWETSLTSG